MHQFAEYLTPEEVIKRKIFQATLKELRENAKDDSMCDVCENNPVWRLPGLGMCFTCVTGETDASEDFELLLDSR